MPLKDTARKGTAKNDGLLESTLEKRLARAVKNTGGRYIKLPAEFIAGLPDRLLLLPKGRIIFLELKRYGKKPTAIQEYWLTLLASLGFTARFIAGSKQLDTFIEKFL